MKADSTVVVVWWLWMLTALLALPLPMMWAAAVCTRGLESVRSSGIGGGEIAPLSMLPALLALFTSPALVILSSLYAFLFWNRRRRGLRIGARFWLPIWGTVVLLVMLSVMVLSTLVDAHDL
jgi:hypothetical protein